MKKSVKLIFSLVIAIICIVGNAPLKSCPSADLLALTASAEVDGIYQYMITDGKATITSCDENASGNIVVPPQLGGFPVAAIGDVAFYNGQNLTGITIPNSVTNIGSSAFVGCSKLSSILIPNSVKTIGSEAFGGCSSLTGISLPNSITTIEQATFSACGLKSITIPNSVTKIDSFAFKWCVDLVSVVIPNSVTFIGNDAFQGCQNLLNINIPNGVNSISDAAFSQCKSLKQITIPVSVKVVGYGTFYGCTGLTSIDIPSGVTTIEDSAFYYCTELKSIYIPASVTSIGEKTFVKCDKLTIYGPAGSYAQSYAGIFSIPFIPKAEPVTNPPATTVRPSITNANKPGTTQTVSVITETVNSSDITTVITESSATEGINSESQYQTTTGLNGDLSETGKPSLKRVLVIVLPVCGLLGIGSVAAYIIIKKKRLAA